MIFGHGVCEEIICNLKFIVQEKKLKKKVVYAYHKSKPKISLC